MNAIHHKIRDNGGYVSKAIIFEGRLDDALELRFYE